MKDKYRRGVGAAFLALIVAVFVLVPQVTATSDYASALQNVYGVSTCDTCHIGTTSDVVLTAYGTDFTNQTNYSSDPEAALIAIGEPPDTQSPVINDISLDTYTPNTGDNILITVNSTDNVEVVSVVADVYGVSNVGVSNVAVDHVELSLAGDVWSGTIVARNGTYNVKVSASDEAGNVAEDNSTSYTGTDAAQADELPPVINDVNLDIYTPNTGDNILITVNSTDNVEVVSVVADVYGVSNVGVSNVAVDHVELSLADDVWSGTIVARNGTYNVKVSASDEAGNVAEDNSTSYTGTDRQNFSFEFGVSNLSLTVEKDVIATYLLTIKNTGQKPDTYSLTVNGQNNTTVVLSKTKIDLKPENSSVVVLNISSSVAGKYIVNVTAKSDKSPSGGNIAVSTETTVVEPSYVKAFYVGDGNRSGSIKSYIKVTNLDDVGHWFAIVIGGIDPLTGYPLVGTGTLYLEAGETAEKVPVLITVPASANVGVYQLYVGIYNYDKGILNQSTLIGDIQGPKPSTVS